MKNDQKQHHQRQRRHPRQRRCRRHRRHSHLRSHHHHSHLHRRHQHHHHYHRQPFNQRNMQRNYKRDTPLSGTETIRSHLLKIKREITKYIPWQQFTKFTRGKPNEQLFPRQVVIQLPKYVTHIIGEPKYTYGQQEQISVRNHNRSTALEWSLLKYWGLKPVLRDPNLALSFCYGSKKLLHTNEYTNNRKDNKLVFLHE